MARQEKSGGSVSPKTPSEVSELLRQAAKPSLTRDEFRAQKVSFAMGMRGDGGMTRRELEELVDQH